jgi:hypothetical protein
MTSARDEYSRKRGIFLLLRDFFGVAAVSRMQKAFASKDQILLGQ